ncbi:MAG TPA: hypothetical protein VEH27_18755 [Methylomirabilota bacterium]|nr:hypothetical protein [Methylomirabilota bacterium]
MKKIAQKALLSLSGLALATAFGTAQAQQVTTNTLSVTTFDPEASANGSYGYFYGNTIDGVTYGSQSVQAQFYAPEDVDLTNGMWRYTFDNTDLNGAAGYGTGTGGGLFVGNTTTDMFTSTNREDYRITFRARVEGLAEGQTSAQGEMQVSFWYPNPEGGANLRSLQVNLPFAPTAEWRTYTYDLSEGSFAENTSERTFAANGTNTTDLRFNVNFHDPHNRFGYDAENVLMLDDVAIQLVAQPKAPEVPKYGVPILAWNFDDTNLWFEYHYQWSQNTINPVSSAEANVNGGAPNTVGKDGTGGWLLNLDTTDLASMPPQWAGGGTGGGGPADYTLFDTNDLAQYRIVFDGRVSGLAEGRTEATTVLQLHIDAADDTLAADEDTTADSVGRLDIQLPGVTTNWQTFSYTLNKGVFAQGSKENFAKAVGNITAVRTQWQIENLGDVNLWGYDAENSFTIDNVRLERLYPVQAGGNPGRITATLQGQNLVLTWNATNAKLQSTSDLQNPNWTDVTGATSGYSTPVTGARRFFRLVQQ